MQFLLESYEEQARRWPKSGQQILAHYTDEHIVVYQAYKPSIGQFAAKNGYFGGDDFSLSRMSWIKPNFLWMMFRSGWGTKVDQEIVLAVWLKRSAFDLILSQAVHSSFVPEIYGTEKEWKADVSRSSVRLQWDPDHNPSGHTVARRAIQLGLRGETLRQYAQSGWIAHIENISLFVREQFEYVKARNYTQLLIPSESVYPIADANIARKLGIN